MEQLWNSVDSVVMYIIAVLNGGSLTSLTFYSLLKLLRKKAFHITKKKRKIPSREDFLMTQNLLSADTGNSLHKH